ncbi:uncharacterized protein LOC130815810 [Amaranthus tricolor]|uniref:uncharacterized protein LOC130802716 n=1 Tax=Amaranthus tricolor TaxID=29722 RepID=UPI00258482D7|nr:uncharacterized protein LOC130802716 [Amaranthus tricolor]XP_057522746.1 uncharacterized protein LOC130802716 [Amaranthus tricolor]XP_057522751.1 uncharacterized protein LOC130802716 [Amaranthus tricolor]XP_057522756.1 uncharacterized protein LOC130802716 [Amaranthus tricolor]XP_057522765.1 uncharacterized protein LOC130802716 [Amaranthus tricolor]XP_057522772.1 uncharacterized protein LOC130802716 [Amaranthus tricolor]XP_057538277.1 uncharacterized protein LOC130815810 [Amaranthus tricolo
MEKEIKLLLLKRKTRVVLQHLQQFQRKKQVVTVREENNKRNIAPSSTSTPKKKRKGQLHMLSSPSQMVFLCENLNDKQRTDLKDIGFDGLLMLIIKKSYHSMAKYFIEQYDISTSVFIVNQTCKYSITEYDVCHIFCLPLSENAVIKQSNDNSEYELFEKWKKKLVLYR